MIAATYEMEHYYCTSKSTVIHHNKVSTNDADDDGWVMCAVIRILCGYSMFYVQENKILFLQYTVWTLRCEHRSIIARICVLV